MTCRYNEINQHDALYTAARAYPGGVEALAGRMGISVNVLYKKLRPAVETHHISYEEVSEIIELLETAGKAGSAELALAAFNWRHSRISIRLPDQTPDAGVMFQQVLEIMQEEGQLAQDINNALSGDGRLNESGLAQIEKDLQMCIRALVVLRDEVREKYRTDQAA
jgi:hypothetical protein